MTINYEKSNSVQPWLSEMKVARSHSEKQTEHLKSLVYNN